MKRTSHDLAGISQRIAKLSDQLEYQVQLVTEVWKDDVGRSFIQQHLQHVSPQLRQLTSEMTSAIEDFESIAKQLLDPDRP